MIGEVAKGGISVVRDIMALPALTPRLEERYSAEAETALCKPFSSRVRYTPDPPAVLS